MKSYAGPWIQYDLGPYKSRRLGHVQRNDHVKMNGKDTIYQPGREASEEINPA